MSNLARIQSYLQAAGEHVGDLLWWTLEDARISCSQLAHVWTSSGLSPELLPEVPTAEKALKTACREQAVGRSDYLVRLGKDDAQELVFAVVREEKDPEGNVRHSQEARLALHHSTRAFETDAPGHVLVRAICEAYAGLLNMHTADDIRRTVLRALDSFAAVTLREHGGVYWVPVPYATEVRRLQQAVSRIGRSRLDLVPVHATPEGNASLGAAAHSALEREIGDLQVEIRAFVDEPPDRSATLVRRLAVFEDLRAKAQLYRNVLDVQVADLETSLTDLTGKVQALLQSTSH
jgi:hypothetical protein